MVAARIALVLVIPAYLLSYYAFVRSRPVPGYYELTYAGLPAPVARVLAVLHRPLVALDDLRYTRVHSVPSAPPPCPEEMAKLEFDLAPYLATTKPTDHEPRKQP